MSNVGGTRSWQLAPELKIGGDVFVNAKYFDKTGTSSFSSTLPYEGRSILKGVVKHLYSNSACIFFDFDETAVSVAKTALKTAIPTDEAQFVVENNGTSSANGAIETLQVHLNSHHSSDAESEIDDEVEDPDYVCPKELQPTSSDCDEVLIAVEIDVSNQQFFSSTSLPVQGEEVILCYNDKLIFKATYD